MSIASGLAILSLFQGGMMAKYLFLFFLVAACTQSNTRKVVQDVSKGLDKAPNYHAYMDEVVVPASEKMIANYKNNPEEVCSTLKEMPSSELINLNDVLEEVKENVSCATVALDRINVFYDTYRASQVSVNARSAKFSKAISTQLETSAVILDKAYSLPSEKQLPGKLINLTFDDGPHATNTEKVLTTLKRYGVKANFFIVGKNANARPNLVKAVANDGHSVGGHSMTHSNLSKIGFSKATKEINGVFDVIESILGATDPFFRFPYGARTTALRNFLKQNNASDFFWNVDTLDWKYKDPEFLLKYALNQTTKTGRGIVLFHDIQPQTAAILPSYLDALANAGYSTIVYEPR